MLKQFGREIWIADGPAVVTAGFQYPTRMAIIRLSGGGLFIWSPIQLVESLRAEVDALGDVRFLVAPKTGEVDGVFSSFKLPEREQFLAFSKEPLTTQVIAFFARRDSTQSFDGDLGKLREVKIGIIQGTSYGQRFDAAVTDGALPNVEQANSAESNLKKLAFGRVDLIPSYRYVVLDTAKQLDLLSQIKEVSPQLEAVPTYLAFTKVRDLSKPSEGFDAALASMKQDGTYDRIIGQYPK
jgi:polar amino acid transport system substrate-binding protein